MHRILISTALVALALPGMADAQFRRAPSPLPAPRAPAPTDIHRGGWDTRAQDKWDRALRKCLNDRRQSKRERRECADMGMPVKR